MCPRAHTRKDVRLSNSIDNTQHGFNLFSRLRACHSPSIWSGTDRIRVLCRQDAALPQMNSLIHSLSLLDGDERNKKEDSSSSSSSERRCNRSLFNFSGSSTMIKRQEEIIVQNWDQARRRNQIKQRAIHFDVHDQQVDKWEIEKVTKGWHVRWHSSADIHRQIGLRLADKRRVSFRVSIKV